MKIITNRLQGKTKRTTLLLGGASAMVIAAYAPFSAIAATTLLEYNDLDFSDSGTGSAVATGDEALASTLVNSAPVIAEIAGGVQSTNTTGTGAVDISALGTDENLFDATAIGTQVDSLADIGLSSGGGDGLGVISVQVNDPDSSVTSSVLNTQIGSTVDTVSGSSLSADENTMTASSILNDGRTVVDGSIYADLASASDIAGEANFGSASTDDIDSAGTIAVTSAQLNTDDGAEAGDAEIQSSRALVTDSSVGIEVENTSGSATSGSATSGAFTVDENELQASFSGNVAETGVDASSQTEFEGSIAVANQQFNTLLTEGSLARNNRNFIGVELGTSGDSTLDGSVSVADNQSGALATGNEADNFILFEAGTSLTGAGNAASTAATATLDTFGEPSSTTADLTLVNQQVNSPFTTQSNTANNQIGVRFDDIDTASSIAVGDNTLFSEATGNTGANAIEVSANEIDATAALSSAQVVGRRAEAAGGVEGSADTRARVADSSIGVETTDFADTSLEDNSIDVTGNRAAARAEGSAVDNTLALDAGTNLDAGTGTDGASVAGSFNLTSDPISEVTTEAGAALSNFQGLVNSVTDARTVNVSIGLDGDMSDTDGGIDSSDIVVDANSLSATALGLTGENELALSGTNVDGSAALASFQVHGGQDEDGLTSALVRDGRIGSTVDLDGDDMMASTVSVDDNTVSAAARGSTISNTLDLSASSTLTLQGGGSLAVSLNDPSSGSGTSASGQLTPEITADAGAILANTQISNSQTSASVTNQQLGSLIDGGVDGSTVTVDGNEVSADAIGNLVAAQSPGNHLILNAGTLDASGTGTIAALANVQDLTDSAGDGSAAVSASADDVFFDSDVFGNATESDLSSSSNTLTARAMGNLTSENRITVTGGSLVAEDGTGANSMVVGLADTATQPMSIMDVNTSTGSSFALTNVQRGSVDGVEADVGTDEGVGADVTITGDVLSSNVDVLDNEFAARAFDNTATNTIAFEDATEVATTTSLQNQQIAAGSSSATAGGADEEVITTTTTTELLNLSTDAGFNTADGNAQLLEEADDSGTLTIDFSDVQDPDQQAALIDLLEDQLSGGEVVNGTYTFDFGAGEDVDLGFLNLTSIVDFTDLASASGGSIDADASLTSQTIERTPFSPGIIADIGGDITGSDIDVSANEVMAEARANLATNALSVDATTVRSGDITGNVGTVIADTTSVSIDQTADNAVSSLQTRDPDATVEAEAFSAIGVVTNLDDNGNDPDGPAITGSSLIVDDNEQVARAEGNVAQNSLSVEGTTIGEDGGPAVSNALSSVQVSQAGGSALSGMDLFAPMAIEDSSMSISGNTNLASTTLNTATNTASVDGTNVLGDGTEGTFLFTLDTPSIGGLSFGEASVTANTSLINMQVNAAEDASEIASAEAVTTIGNPDAPLADSRGLITSSVTTDGNRSDALATGNTATNMVSQNGAANLDTSAALANLQLNEIEVSADSTLDMALELTSELELGHFNSSISMSDNINVARGTANVAQNSMEISGTNITGPVSPLGSGIAFLSDGASNLGTEEAENLLGGEVAAVGSAAVSNQQWSLEDVSADATTSIVTSDSSGGILGTSMVQDDNLTIAEASGNISGVNGAEHTVSVTGTNIDGAAVALSDQVGTGDVSANATVDIANNIEAFGGELEASEVSISGNQTGAFATQNDAVTSVNVAGTSITGSEIDNFAGLGSGTTPAGGDDIGFSGSVTVGDNLVLGQQDSEGAVTSDVSVIGAVDFAGSDSQGIVGSSIAVDGNIGESSAAANRARNSLTLNAETTLAATGALGNVQTSSSDVTASTVMDLGVGNNASTFGSSVSIDGNTGIARARGNTSTNTMAVSAGSGIDTGTNIDGATAAVGGISSSTVNSDQGSVARADYAVLNGQSNSGAVTADVTGSFGSVDNTGIIDSSSVSVSGNTFAANAIGNSATNELSASVRSNAGTSMAMVNRQANSGDVTARANGAGSSISTGSMSSSSSSVSNNRVSARAVGNSAVNRLSRD